MTTRIRRARPDEAAELSRLARASKAHWGYPERWLDLWQDELTLSEDEIARQDVFVAESDGELLGFYALDADARTLQHLWVRPQAIGTGVGRMLLFDALRRAAARGAGGLELVSDPNAAGFYERLGGRLLGEEETRIEGRPRRLPRYRLECPGSGRAPDPGGSS